MNKKILTAALLLIGLGSAQADDGKELTQLLQASGCMSCHSVSEKIVGPAFKDIAIKNAGDGDAVATLSQSIKNGSRGKWGRTPMPPHSSLTNENIAKLAAWVLNQKP
ncbi:MAG: c-type cytochrome [Rhodoferax sp.]|nr:c-type cytochrome [Rhodoferax sp.]